MFDQQVVHGDRRNPKKVRAIAPITIVVSRQSKVSLVNERRGLQRVISPLSVHQAAGQSAKFIVYERQQLHGRAPVAIAERLQ
jgi:hypothetical protein